MFSRRTDSNQATTETIKGPSLARGPAWIVGLVLSIAGMAMFFKAPGTPLSATEFPDGVATGVTWLGFEMNAWTAWMTAAVGVFVLVGAAQHLAARTFSLIAGLALGAMAMIALIDGSDVLGLAAANGLDALAWGIAAAVLLVTALLPRIRHQREIGTAGHTATDQSSIADQDRARIAKRERSSQPIATREGEPVAEHDRHRVADYDQTAHREPIDADVDPQRTAGPAGTRSEPLRRTYEGQPQPQTEAERAAQAQRAEDQTRTSH